ncbi:MAG TPA: hypothetical protein VFL54_03705 [Gammaproteobacteria bacterium]|nr:hypothetical protein [Gammaproteobacteria bacterium]
MCTRDGGRLWGVSLCGPMMFVDPASREAMLNEPAPGAVRDGSLYRITLPASIGLANTAFEFKGKRWSMVLWPLPKDKDKRDVLLMHESYHRIQPALGLAPSGRPGANAHLDSEFGRVWLRAELHALRAALNAHGEARRRAIADALRFRVYRRSLWPSAAAEEDALELNEGLAESTGIDAGLATAKVRMAAAVDDIDRHEKDPSYVRSFAYATGPAYAELLDAAAPGWRRDVNEHFDFGEAVAHRYNITMPAGSAKLAHEALQHYDGNTILAQEASRAKRVAVRNRRYTVEFIGGPTLTFPLVHMQISFDPREVESFAGHGSVYHTLTVSDTWGTLEVQSGDALIDSKFKTVTVPLSETSKCSAPAGRGWSLKLEPGFKSKPDAGKKNSCVAARADDKSVTRTQPR